MSKLSSKHVNESMNQFVAHSLDFQPANIIESLLAVNNSIFYTEADSFAGNPDGLLGSVIQVRIINKNSNQKTNVLEFCPTKIPNTAIDQTSHLKEPIKRQSIIVDQKLTNEVNFLNYLSTQIDSTTTYSLLVFDQATGQVDRNQKSWAEGVKRWKADNQDIINDPAITNIFILIGYVQKYVIRKKYKKFDVKAKGGGYGINVSGELYTSSEDYSLDVRYGLTIASLKESSNINRMGVAPSPIKTKITSKQLKMLMSFEKINKAVK